MLRWYLDKQTTQNHTGGSYTAQVFVLMSTGVTLYRIINAGNYKEQVIKTFKSNFCTYIIIYRSKQRILNLKLVK